MCINVNMETGSGDLLLSYLKDDMSVKPHYNLVL